MSFVVQITEANAEKMKRTVLSLLILFSVIFFIQTCEGHRHGTIRRLQSTVLFISDFCGSFSKKT